MPDEVIQISYTRLLLGPACIAGKGRTIECGEFNPGFGRGFFFTCAICQQHEVTEPVLISEDTYKIALGARGGFPTSAEVLREHNASGELLRFKSKQIEVQATESSGVQLWTPQSNKVVFKCIPNRSVNAVLTVLEYEKWAKRSDREIARQANVSHPFVASVRPDLTGNVTSEKTYTTKHGTTAPIKFNTFGE